ncbi:unnamed protein product [Sympodiomycopsis kandeliae]
MEAAMVVSSNKASSEALSFTQGLNKIELHAHLNGSIRRSTVQELCEAKGLDASKSQILQNDVRTISEMFDVFKIIHTCVRGGEVVKRISREVLEDAEHDNIVYLELRTTPRAHDECHLSIEEYIESVLEGFDDYKRATSSKTPCEVRLLLSIDRNDPPENTLRTVELALKYQHRGVVGVDLSGNPTKGVFSSWLPALQSARSKGLKISLHAGEVPNTDQEMTEMLQFHPGRLGHVCFISPSNATILKAKKIPIELCLTSNILSNPSTIPTYKDHHFLKHYEVDHPITLCTDDVAVFGSTLSNELALAMEHFNLSPTEIKTIVRDSLQSTFLDKSSETYQRVQGLLESQ